MVSEFRRQKYLHLFYAFFDTDKSGSIDRKDFALAMSNVAKQRGYSPGDVTYELLKEMLLTMWEGLLKSADTDGDGVVNAEEWVKCWDEYAKNPAGATEWQKLYAKCIFQLEDSGHDGTIDAEEFSSVYESFGLNKAESLEAFKKLAGGKKSINWDEFEALFKEYFTTEDPNAPGNYLFGQLK